MVHAEIGALYVSSCAATKHFHVHGSSTFKKVFQNRWLCIEDGKKYADWEIDLIRSDCDSAWVF